MFERELETPQPELHPLFQSKITYSVNDLSQLHGLSRRSVIRLYENEAGVQTLNRPELVSKRRYRTIRVPCAVYERVCLRLEGRLQ